MEDEPVKEKSLLEVLDNISKDGTLITEFILKVNEEGENTILNIAVFNLDLRHQKEVDSVIQSIKDLFEFYNEFLKIKQLKNVKDNEQNII
jgi:hypothetical protein